MFYIKLAIITGAPALVPRLRHVVAAGGGADERPSRKTALLAITSVVLWAAAIIFGRLLPYTYHRLLVFD